MKRIWIGLLIVFLIVTTQTAFAEFERGSLEGRFATEDSIERDGVSYRVRPKLTTLAFLCVAQDEGETVPALLMVVAVDDSAKTASVIQIDCRTEVRTGEGAVPFNALMTEWTDLTAVGETVRTAVNGLFPTDLLEHYFVLNLEGLDSLHDSRWEHQDSDEPQDEESGEDRTEVLTRTVKNRLKACKAEAEKLGSSELLDLFDRLSGYLKTDLKSGALMKLADKAEKYDIQPTLYPEGTWSEGVFRPDSAAMEDMVFQIFYEEDFWMNEYGEEGE